MIVKQSQFSNAQPQTHGKQKWRFLGLNDAFRLAENIRFHLKISFGSATYPWKRYSFSSY